MIMKYLNLACKYPPIVRTTSFAEVCLIIIKNYLLFYKNTQNNLVVIAILDSVRDQANLKL